MAEARRRRRTCLDEGAPIQYGYLTIPLCRVPDDDLAGGAPGCLGQDRPDPLRWVVPKDVSRATQTVRDRLVVLSSAQWRVWTEMNGRTAFPSPGTFADGGFCKTEDVTARWPEDPVTRAPMPPILILSRKMRPDGPGRAGQREGFRSFRHVGVPVSVICNDVQPNQ